MTTSTYKRFTVRGISDKTECDVCGKTNLKMTIVIESEETGELLHYGSDCAARTLRQAGAVLQRVAHGAHLRVAHPQAK